MKLVQFLAAVKVIGPTAPKYPLLLTYISGAQPVRQKSFDCITCIPKSTQILFVLPTQIVTNIRQRLFTSIMVFIEY